MADNKEIKEIEGSYLLFRGKPLCRNKNAICYGSMADDYILFLLILSTKTAETSNPKIKTEVPDKILVQILSTDPKKSPTERMVKQFDRSGLYEAFDIGLVWLNKLNRRKKVQ